MNVSNYYLISNLECHIINSYDDCDLSIPIFLIK